MRANPFRGVAIRRRLSSLCPRKNKCPGPRRAPECEEEVFSPPEFIKIIGPKQIEATKHHLPSIITWPMFGFATTLYFTDWKAVTSYIPFYNGKFSTLEESKYDEKGEDQVGDIVDVSDGADVDVVGADAGLTDADTSTATTDEIAEDEDVEESAPEADSDADVFAAAESEEDVPESELIEKPSQEVS